MPVQYRPSGRRRRPRTDVVSDAQAAAEATRRMRINLLINEVPNIGLYEDQVIELANGSMDVDTMIRTAMGAIDGQTIELMVDQYNAMPWEQRQAQVSLMSPGKRTALQAAGLNMSPPKKEGFLDRLKPDSPGEFFNTLSHPLAPVVNAARDAVPIPDQLGVVGKVLGFKPIEAGMQALDYPRQRVNQILRTGEYLSDSQQLQAQSGMNEQQLRARGINAPTLDDPMVAATGLAGAFAVGKDLVLNRGRDTWTAIKTYRSLGHNGENDILPSVQNQVYEAYRAQYGDDRATTFTPAAVQLAGGATFDDIADMQGLSGDEAEQLKGELSAAMVDPVFRRGIERMENYGRMSPGRTFARELWQTWTDEAPNTSTGAASWASGSFDTAWAIVGDPVNVAGTVYKSMRGAKYLYSAKGNAAEIRLSARIARAEEIGDDPAQLIGSWRDETVQHAAEALGWEDLTDRQRAAVVKRGERFLGFAQDVSDTMRDGKGWAQLYQKYKGLVNQEQNLADFEAWNRAHGLRTMAEDPDRVFAFMEYLDQAKETVATVDGAFTLPKKSDTTIFGHDPTGRLWPHMTGRRRVLLGLDEKLRGWRGWQNPIEAAPSILDDAYAEATDLLSDTRVRDTVADELSAVRGVTVDPDELAERLRRIVATHTDEGSLDEHSSLLRGEMGLGPDQFVGETERRWLVDNYPLPDPGDVTVRPVEGEFADIVSDVAMLSNEDALWVSLWWELSNKARGWLDAAVSGRNPTTGGIGRSMDETGNFTRNGPLRVAKTNFLKRIAGDLWVATSSKLPEAPGRLEIRATDARKTTEEFSKWNNAWMVLMHEPQDLADARLDLWVNGSDAARQALATDVMTKFASLGGLDQTREGRALLEQLIGNQNKAFGLGENVIAGQFESIDGFTHKGRLMKLALHRDQMRAWMELPDFKEALIATRGVNFMRGTFGAVRSSWVETAMQRWWKPIQLLRFGFPLRAGADEMLQYMLRVGTLQFVRSGYLEPRAAGEAPIRVFRRMGEGIQVMSRTTDKALQMAAMERASSLDRQYVAARLAGRHQEADRLLEPYIREALAEKRWLPRAAHAAGSWAERTAAMSSKAFHDYITRDHKPGEWAATQALKLWRDNAERIEVFRDIGMTHPTVQHAHAEILHGSISDIRPNDPTLDPTGIGRMVIAEDTPTGWRWVPTKLDYNNQQWIRSHADPSSFYMALAHNMQSMGSSYEALPALRAFRHHVPQSTFDELARYGLVGEDPLGDLRQIRDSIDQVRDLMLSAGRAFNLEDLVARAQRGEGFIHIDGAPDLNRVFARFNDYTPTTRSLLFDQGIDTDGLNDNLDVIYGRAADGVQRALTSLPGQHELRKSLRAQLVNGKMIPQPLREGYDRWYYPLIDRRDMELMADVLQQESVQPGQFRELLTRVWRERRLDPEQLNALWMSMHPSSGTMDFATAMQQVRDAAITGRVNYVPPLFAASTNPDIAEALRATVADYLSRHAGSRTAIAPTIGWFDNPQGAFGPMQGVMPFDNSIAQISPTKYLQGNPIDPEDSVTMYRVRFADGQVITMTRQELDEWGTGTGRARLVRSKPVFFEDGPLTRYNAFTQVGAGRPGMVEFNPRAIEHDWQHRDASFLRGQLTDVGRTRVEYDLRVPLPGDRRLLAHFDQLVQDLSNGQVNLQDVMRAYRQQQHNPRTVVPMQDALEDWGFVPLDGNAIQRNVDGTQMSQWQALKQLLDDAGMRREIVPPTPQEVWTNLDAETASANVASALLEMGVDVDDVVAFIRGRGRPNASSKQVRLYQRLLTSREQALQVLRPANVRGRRAEFLGRAETDLEQDAMAFALNEIGYKPVGPSPFTGKWPTRYLEGDDFQILSTVQGSGTTEIAGMRRLAQDIVGEADRLFTNRVDGGFHHRFLSSLERGTFSQEELFDVNIDSLPWQDHGPAIVDVPRDKWFELNADIHQESFNPWIGAMARTPQFVDNMVVGARENAPLLANLRAGAEQRADAEAILAKFGLDIDDFDQLNKHTTYSVMNDPTFGADDPEALMIRGVFEESNREASSRLAEFAQLRGYEGRPGLLNAEEQIRLGAFLKRDANAWDYYRERTVQRAFDLTVPFIDNAAIRGIYQEYLGPVVAPYWYAEEQFLRRFARGLYQNPLMLKKAQLGLNGMRNIGLIEEDPYGNPIFVIPLSEYGTRAIGRVASLVTGNEMYALQSGPMGINLNFAVPGWSADTPQFGFGPLIGMGTSGLRYNFPELDFRQQGPDRRDIVEQILPGPIAGAYKAFLKDPDPTQINSALAGAIQTLEAAGHGLPENATLSEQEEYLENVRAVTRLYGVGRYATGMLTFARVQPVDMAAIHRQEFIDLLETGMSYEDALRVFLEGKDTGEIAYTVFPSENLAEGTLGSSTADFQWLRANATFAQDNPMLAPWLMPGEEGFDPRAYNQQTALGLRRAREPQEMIDQFHIRAASPQYFDFRESNRARWRELKRRVDSGTLNPEADARLRAEMKQLDEDWSIFSTAYRNQHPTFAASFGAEGSNDRKKIIDGLAWATDPELSALQGNEQAALIRPLVLMYRTYKMQYDAYQEQNSQAARNARAELLDDFYTDAWVYVNGNPGTKDFFESIIRPELPDAADMISDRLEGVA